MIICRYDTTLDITLKYEVSPFSTIQGPMRFGTCTESHPDGEDFGFFVNGDSQLLIGTGSKRFKYRINNGAYQQMRTDEDIKKFYMEIVKQQTEETLEVL